MIKQVLVAMGVMAIAVGGIDWRLGAMVLHSRFLLGAGAVALVAAGFLHLREKSFTLPFMIMTFL